jgi:hypothetical protein
MTFETRKPPRFRMLCHCTICQRFNKQPFADVLIYRAGDVEMPEAGTVDFAIYKPPPNVQRGRCSSCRAPVIETFHVPLLPKLTMVPRSMLPPDAELPEPVAHFFYETRQADANDSLPKHDGFWPSQTAFLKYYLRSGKVGRETSFY